MVCEQGAILAADCHGLSGVRPYMPLSGWLTRRVGVGLFWGAVFRVTWQVSVALVWGGKGVLWVMGHEPGGAP
jgi:hypothetical protein